MGIKVGTLVTRVQMDESGHLHFPCKTMNYHPEDPNDDFHIELGVCIGMVIDVTVAQKPDKTANYLFTVNWLQICAYHQRVRIPRQEVIDPDNLWEIGQLL